MHIEELADAAAIIRNWTGRMNKNLMSTDFLD
jgi:hypothetical protein